MSVPWWMYGPFPAGCQPCNKGYFPCNNSPRTNDSSCLKRGLSVVWSAVAGNEPYPLFIAPPFRLGLATAVHLQLKDSRSARRSETPWTRASCRLF